MFRTFFVTLLTIFLAACVTAPTRSDPSAFALVQQGQIPASSVRAFTDCLMDGFNAAHFILTNITVRQQRRTEGYRVEALTNSALLVSADISENGRVELFESRTAALINTSGERKAFASCLDRFRATNSSAAVGSAR